MQGLLADANANGELAYLLRLMKDADLWDLLIDLGLSFTTFKDLQIPLDLDDRSLWSFCQENEWVLFTDNRNHAGINSLEATLRDSWQIGCLPVITLGNKTRFQNDRAYAEDVAMDVADLLYGIQRGGMREIPRIFVPL